MPESDVVRAALRFVNEINRHDVAALLNLMSEDHLFVDALGQEVRGKDRLREAWNGYFTLVPDYRIVIEDHMQAGLVVGLFGSAAGTLSVGGVLAPSGRWKTPAAWRAVVRDGRIERWQVFADNEPVRKLLAARPA